MKTNPHLLRQMPDAGLVQMVACARPRGVALIVVLAMLVLLSGIVVAFFSNVTTEASSATSYASSASVKMLADSALNLAQAQIRDATRGHEADRPGSILAWASQPGMIRTFDGTGKPQKIYKLYSADTLVAPADGFEPELATLPAGWNKGRLTDVFADLNAPGVDVSGDLIYPIVHPLAGEQVEGFSITAPPGFLPGKTEGPDNNRAPMPVKWLYLLQDGTLTAASSPDPETVVVAKATSENPIIGRVAFWADDETAKVNINTASEGVYWDVPRIYSMEDAGQFSGTGVGIPGMALCQPAQREYQRYPGHPATTSLSPILGKILPLVTPITLANANRFDPYYLIAPRVVGGGSSAGTKMPTAPLTEDPDRLYATVDELMFTGKLAGEARITNTGTTGQPAKITRQVLERTKFFLTASSSAPETTLFNTPRVAIWPVWSVESEKIGKKRTAYDKLAAFCATVGPSGSPAGTKEYYFTRSDPRSTTADYTSRNRILYEYLQALTARDIPGFGGNFLEKFGPGLDNITDRDQILTSIYDYIRCTSLQDRSAGASPYTPPFIQPAPLGAGEVVPIKIGQTQGFGRFYSVSEAAILFYGTKATAGKTEAMKAHLILEFASPMQGLGAMRSNMKYSVTGLDKLEYKVGDGNWTPLGFAAGGTNFMDRADLDTFHGRSLGGTEGPTQAFLTGGGQKAFVPGSTTARNQYPFVTSTDVPIAGGALKFKFRSRLPTDEIEIKIETATNPTQLVQTVKLAFPEGEFKTPGYLATRPINATFDLIRSVDTVVGLEPAGVLGNVPDSKADPTAGDTRMTEALPVVPSSRFRAHLKYAESGVQFAHGLLTAVGAGVPGDGYLGGTYGKLINVGYFQTATPKISRQPDVPSRVPAQVQRKDTFPGDWDTGIGDQKDGAYINKPDEGDTVFTDQQQGQTRLPYFFGYGQGFASATQTYFSPNRQVPSPLMFGSIPTGVQRYLPWQTLLFHPRPEDLTHPGKNSPPDHLLADLFWMPVIEPYAISQPFATSGKINMNYEIQPFTYIRRDTGLRAVMKATKFMALPATAASTYKPLDPGNNASRSPNYRQAIDLPAPPTQIPETLKAFDRKFANKEVFKSATQICEMHLIPKGETEATMAAFWRKNALTGDNLREKPYVDIYPRLTTKSNTFTVHVRVQALKKARNTPPNQWVQGKDQVLADQRGSSIIERYIDLNDKRLPDFADLFAKNGNSEKLNIDQYYKMRVVSTKVFVP